MKRLSSLTSCAVPFSLALPLCLLACGASPAGALADAEVPPPEVDASAADSALAASGVLGVLQQPAYPSPPTFPRADEPPAMSDSTRIAVAQALHVDAMRSSLRFLGGGASTGIPFGIEIRDAGLQLAVTVLPGPPDANGATPPLAPSQINEYKANLASAISQVTPALIMVENEEIAPHFYTGDPSTYALELAAAVEVGHAHGVPVTNGGLTNVPCRLLTWFSYYQAHDFARADSFAARAFKPTTVKQLPDAQAPDRPIPSDLLDQINAATAYMAVYKASKMDYLNIHLYFATQQVANLGNTPTADDIAATMGEIITYVASASGKPVLSGEMGQYDLAPATVDGMLRAAASHRFPFAIWFSGDGDPALSLVSSTTTGAGFALRPSGSELAALADTIH